MKPSNNILLFLGALLIGYGLITPYINNISVPSGTISVVMPLDVSLKNNCEKVTQVFKNGFGNKQNDGFKLASLYIDLAKLIALDESNEIILNTDQIRETNKLAGKLYDLNLQDKYPDLARAANDVIVQYIGDENVILDKELRKKAVEAFNGLAWAFYEGSK